MKKRISALLLGAVLLVSAVSPIAAEAGAPGISTNNNTTTYTGRELIAVNPDLNTVDIDGTDKTTDDVPKGSFTVPQLNDEALTPAVMEAMLDASEGEERMDYHIDPETGEPSWIIPYEMEQLEPIGWAGEQPAEAQQAKGGNKPNNDDATTKTLYYTKNNKRCSVEMKRLYVGTHCTVWGSTSDNTNIQIDGKTTQITKPEAGTVTVPIAEAIAWEFDSKFDAMSSAFGDYWYDADGDGKVAIMCYDLNNEYPDRPGGYTLGYFWMVDMISASGKIKDINYGSGNGNAIDCIHIDTFPTMGGSSSTLLKNVSNCYSTLIHEYQHMLNYSYQVKNGYSGYYTYMETYLNEAFSMAAQHMITGPESVQHRIDDFNGDEYYYGYGTYGNSLTSWYDDYSYPNYSYSYLFGQYLRTQWAQSPYNTNKEASPEGNDLFKKVLTSRNSSNDDDTLQIIADLLHTTKLQLVIDFWAAVYCRDDTGEYGFNGESWADYIKVDTADSTEDIWSGGAKFYEISSGSVNVTDPTNLVFSVVGEDGSVLSGSAPILSTAEAYQSDRNTVSASLKFTGTGTLHYGIADKTKTALRVELGSSQAIKDGEAISLNLTDEEISGGNMALYYYVTDSSGISSGVNRVNIAPAVMGSASGTLTGTIHAALYTKADEPALVREADLSGGSFCFTKIPDGEYSLRFTQTGAVTREVPVTVSGGGVVLDQVLMAQLGDLAGTGDTSASGIANNMECLYEYLSTMTSESTLAAADEAYFRQVADINQDGSVNILDYQSMYELMQEAAKAAVS